jgi:hypothetical protein
VASQTNAVVFVSTAVGKVEVSGSVTAIASGTRTISGGVTLLSSTILMVSSAPAAVSAAITGGVTLLSSIYLPVNINTFTAGTVSLLNTATPGFVTGGVTLLSATTLFVSSGATGVVLVSSAALTGKFQVTGQVTSLVTGTVTAVVTGGVTLLSSAVIGINVLKSCGPFTSTWVYVALTSSTNTVVWKPAATKRFNMTDLTISSPSAGLVTVTQDTATTVTIAKVQLAANGGWSAGFVTPWVATQTNHGLVIKGDMSGTTSIYVVVSGYESA